MLYSKCILDEGQGGSRVAKRYPTPTRPHQEKPDNRYDDQISNSNKSEKARGQLGAGTQIQRRAQNPVRQQTAVAEELHHLDLDAQILGSFTHPFPRGGSLSRATIRFPVIPKVAPGFRGVAPPTP